MSFLDIDEILNEEERIPVTFKGEAMALGHLDSNVESEHLPQGSRVEIPLV